MRYLVGLVFVLVLSVTGCGETEGTGGSGGDGGTGGTGGTTEQCDDGTRAAYDSATCGTCIACAIVGPCEQCDAQSCHDFVRCVLGCTSEACLSDCIDLYPTGADLFGEAYVCGACDTCPNNCGFPPSPFFCDSVGLRCFRDIDCTDSLICCQPEGPFTLGVCVTQAVCDELQGGSGTGDTTGNGGNDL